MFGAIIGDIVGSRFEFNNTNTSKFELFTQMNDFTDDSICTIAVADAINTQADYQSTIHEWCRKYPHPKGGYGGNFAIWVQSNHPQAYNSFGNGSAMRVSPVAWAFNDLETVQKEAEKTAVVTHNHPEGIKGAICTASAIYVLRKTKDLAKFEDISNSFYPQFKNTKFIQGKFDETCKGTVPVCLQLLLKSNSFEDAIRNAIAWGGDSDTIGAIVGAMAEALWGIPQEIETKALSYLTKDMKKVIKDFQTHIK